METIKGKVHGFDKERITVGQIKEVKMKMKKRG